MFLYNENNNNLLSPILGQYNIKAQDLIDLVKSKFNDIYDLSSFLIFNILIIYTKKRYEVKLRQFNEINMFNTFYQYKQYLKFFDILFFYKNFLLKNFKHKDDTSFGQNINYNSHILFYFLFFYMFILSPPCEAYLKQISIGYVKLEILKLKVEVFKLETLKSWLKIEEHA